MKTFIMGLLLLIISSSPLVSKEYTGTYNTQTIRLLWMACYQGTMRVDPSNPHYNGALCDCVVNKTRQNYTANEMQKYKGATMQKNYNEMANQCKSILMLTPPPIELFS